MVNKEIKLAPEEAAALIKAACYLNPSLKFKEPGFHYSFKTLKGFCYIATEVFCHMIPEARPYKHNKENHIFAKIGEEIWDLTKDQYDEPLDYNDSYKRNRRSLTKRAQKLLEEVEVLNERGFR